MIDVGGGTGVYALPLASRGYEVHLVDPVPLHVELLYNEYQVVAAFAVASILALLALVTLALKSLIEWRAERAHEAAVRTANAVETTRDALTPLNATACA